MAGSSFDRQNWAEMEVVRSDMRQLRDDKSKLSHEISMFPKTSLHLLIWHASELTSQLRPGRHVIENASPFSLDLSL